MPLSRVQILAVLVALLTTLVAGCEWTDFAVPAADVTHVILEEEVATSGCSGEVYLTVTLDMTPGALTVERRDTAPVERVLPGEDIEQLKALLDKADFYTLDGDYLKVKNNCCGMVSYTITVEKGAETFGVTASSEGMPAGYRDIVLFIEALAE